MVSFYFSVSFLVQNRSKRVRAFSRTSEAMDRLEDGEALGLLAGGDEGASSTLYGEAAKVIDVEDCIATGSEGSGASRTL